MFIDWEKDFYNFCLPTKDMTPYSIVHDKDKSTIVVNMVGIDPNDIKVEIERLRNCDYLVINGETKNKTLNKSFSKSLRFAVDSDEIKKIEYSSENGLLTIEIFYKIPEKQSVEIERK